MNWRRYCFILAVLNVPFLLMLLFIPETPVYLIGKEQIDRAHKVNVSYWNSPKKFS